MLTAITSFIVLSSFALVAEHVTSLAIAARDRRRRVEVVLAPLGACALVVALRLFLIPPSFTHDNFHAAELVDTILGDDAHNPRVTSYGPVGFVVLGTIASWLGPRASTILHANVVLSALALWAFGAVFARAYRSPWITTFTILAGALLPPLARVGFSEDFHALAALYGATSIALFDRFVRKRHRYDALLSVIAAVLMLYTRQTFIPFAPCAVALVLAGHDRVRRSDRAVIAVAATVLGATLLRALQSSTDTTDAGAFATMRFAFVQPHLVGTMLSDHWLIAPSRLGLLLVPATIVGLREAGNTPFARCHLGITLFFFVLTLPFFRANPGAELCMRAPLAFMLLGFVALAAVRLARSAARCVGERGALVLAGLFLIVAPLGTARSRADLAYQSIEYQEYAYVESVVALLPPRFALVEPPREPGQSRIALPRRVFSLAGRRVHYVAAVEEAGRGEDVLLYVGLGCWAYSADGLYEVTAWDRDHLDESPRVRRLVGELFLGRPATVVVPRDMRDACSRLVAQAVPLDVPAGSLEPHDVAPFALFGREDPVPLRFYRVDRSDRPTPRVR